MHPLPCDNWIVGILKIASDPQAPFGIENIEADPVGTVRIVDKVVHAKRPVGNETVFDQSHTAEVHAIMHDRPDVVAILYYGSVRGSNDCVSAAVRGLTDRNAERKQKKCFRFNRRAGGNHKTVSEKIPRRSSPRPLHSSISAELMAA